MIIINVFFVPVSDCIFISHTCGSQLVFNQTAGIFISELNWE